MNFKIMGRFIAQILTIEGVFMVPAALLCLIYREPEALSGFLIAMAAIAITALLLFGLCRKAPRALDAKEGMDLMMNEVMNYLYLVIGGADPATVEVTPETMQQMQAEMMQMQQ